MKTNDCTVVYRTNILLVGDANLKEMCFVNTFAYRRVCRQHRENVDGNTK